MQLVSILDFSISFVFSRKAICMVIYSTGIYNPKVTTRGGVHPGTRRTRDGRHRILGGTRSVEPPHRRTPTDTNTSPFVNVKQNHRSKAIALTHRLSDRRLRRVINLCTQSAEQVPEFDVFLEAPTDKSYLLMTINNVEHVSVKFIFELIRDPIANVCRAQALLDQSTADLQIWFECAHDDSSHLLKTKPRRRRFFSTS